jgi:hypothetical protein
MTVTRWNRISAAAAVLALAAWGTGQARANSIIPELESVTPNGSVYTYTYEIEVSLDSEIHSGSQTVGPQLSLTDGDYFGIFDIPGYVLGSEKISATDPLVTVGGASWVATEQLVGYQPAPETLATVGDNAGLYNVNFQYVGSDAGNSGPQTITATIPPLAVDPDESNHLVLGEISFDSTDPLSISPTVHYSAEDYDSSSGLEESNQGLLRGPGAIPEPATALLGSLALGGAAVLALRRRRVQA